MTGRIITEHSINCPELIAILSTLGWHIGFIRNGIVRGALVVLARVIVSQRPAEHGL